MTATTLATPVPTGASSTAAERPHAALARLLDELADVLRRVSSTTYTARVFPGVSGSIGQHVRHILDHVAGLCATGPSGVLSYDRRQRGTDVEADVSAALQTIVRLEAALTRLDRCDENAPITLSSVLAHGAAPVAVRSTLAREMLFVISHTIHHQALIAVLLSAAGRSVPDTFGLAPSTPLSARLRTLE
jgi:uncharacterized damage-inducible protein DinB